MGTRPLSLQETAMPKPLAYCLSTAAALLCLLTASSALAAQATRPATAHAARHASHHSKAARRRHRKHGAAVHAAKTRRTHRPPVKPVSPVGPVSPVEPTPPIIPTPPTEPVEPVTPPAPPAPTPPTASFTYSPASPVTGQAVLFDGARSSCPDGPCTYEWSDDGGATRPIPVLWPLGSGQTLSYTFSGAGVKYIRLVVTDTLGHTATVEQNVTAGSSPAPAPPPPPPPPSAPTVTTAPSISGTATEGQSLTATSGTWTGEPASYVYQWQDCNVLGEGCLNVSGATGSSYALAASDVGSTVRVVVSATNAGGSTSASSAVTATVAAGPPPPPPPPTASFTYSPTAPVTGQAVTFNGASSTCPDGPCTYEWSDDGGRTRPIPALWPLGSGQTLSFTFSGTGTKYVRLVVTDATDQTATVEHNVVVEEPAPPPPPPAAPSNTGLPAVSGTPEVGQTLTASSGTWSGSTPISYVYQWQDCNSLGESCLNIGAATASSYKLLASDVGHTLRAVVSASNAGGSTAASSAQTAAVAAESTGQTGGEPSLTAKECWQNPGASGENTGKIEACGYPGFNNTGVEKGVTLTETTSCSNGHIMLGSNTAIEDKKYVLNGCNIEIAEGAANVTIKNDEIYISGLCGGELCPANAININKNATGIVISHDRIGGTAKTGANVIQTCVNATYGTPYTAEYDKTIYCGGYKLNGGGTLNHDYCSSNFEISGEHYECITDQGSSFVAPGGTKPLVIKNSTVFQPPPNNQNEGSSSHAGMTSALFTQAYGAEITELTAEKDFFAGGARAILAEQGTKLHIMKDRFARCLKATCPKAGGEPMIVGNNGDAHGWFEEAGFYKAFATGSYTPSTAWEGNFLDDDLALLSEGSAKGGIN
jgi:hypothetical protein